MKPIAYLSALAVLVLAACVAGAEHGNDKEHAPPTLRAACAAPFPDARQPLVCVDDPGCRLVRDTCGACTCRAVPAGAPDPVCRGQRVSCFRDPCAGLYAANSSGQCLLFPCACGSSGGELE